MTDTSSHDTTARARISLASLPRVNLLPPEIAEGRRFRQIQTGLAVAVIGSIGIVVLLAVAASHSVGQAKERLGISQATGTQLRAESSRYANVTAVYARATAAQAMLVQAMGDEVRFSQLLNDLSLSIPDNVWITTLTYSAATGTAPLVGSTAMPIGRLSVSGTAFTNNDLALWLESLAVQKAYADPYFSTAAVGKLGTKKVVLFDSTAFVTPAALSHRYDKAGT
jgi:Tfp pilus assembly protein PilN